MLLWCFFLGDSINFYEFYLYYLVGKKTSNMHAHLLDIQFNFNNKNNCKIIRNLFFVADILKQIDFSNTFRDATNCLFVFFVSYLP